MPRVTVAIPAHDAARFIGECLDSVWSQTYRDLEVIVVDDGSSDDTAELAAGKRGTVVVRRPCGGPAAARNEAVRAGSGELVALLDADDAWRPDKLERQLAVLDGEPALLLVASGAENLGRGPSVPLPRPRAGRVTAELIGENFVTTSSVMLRRSVLERAGGFDSDPALVSVEDYDLWLRLSLHGAFGADPAPLVRRRLHDANLSHDHLRLAQRTLAVVEKFERLPASRPYARLIARRKAELCYRMGRAHLARGERAAGRRALRRSRAQAARFAAPCLALEALSWLPRAWLLRLHERRAALRGAP